MSAMKLKQDRNKIVCDTHLSAIGVYRIQFIVLEYCIVHCNCISFHVMVKKKKISHRQLGPLRGSSSPFQHFELARVKPN